MRLRKGDPREPLAAKPPIAVGDCTASPVKTVRRVRAGKPAEGWRQPPRNLRARDFIDGPELDELN